MSTREVEPPPTELHAAFGIDSSQVIDTALKRLHSWVLIAEGGSANVVTIGDTNWSWTAQPRLQKNGAAIGRVYSHRKGELVRDEGGYKIGADGRVLQLPAALRAVLPGGLDALAVVPDANEEITP